MLEEHYDSMKAWVDYMHREAGESLIWGSGFHFGDWLAITSRDKLLPAAVTAIDLIGTAFFAYSTSILVRAASVLGYAADAEMYASLLDDVKQSFCDEFVSPRGRVASDTQTAYTLALAFDLLPEERRPEALRRLVADIRLRENHISSGFVGTSYLPFVLSRFGYQDVAYDLLNQTTCPSWLYPVTMGATTVWERWDGIKPDGEFQDDGMNSFNHYAYGAIGDWLYRVVAGIDVDPNAPGYKHALIRPRPGGGLSYARAGLETMYGKLASEWDLRDGGLRLTATVPANTRATVRIPNAQLCMVLESGNPVEQAPGVSNAVQDGDAVVMEIGSGVYTFKAVLGRSGPIGAE